MAAAAADGRRRLGAHWKTLHNAWKRVGVLNLLKALRGIRIQFRSGLPLLTRMIYSHANLYAGSILFWSFGPDEISTASG